MSEEAAPIPAGNPNGSFLKGCSIGCVLSLALFGLAVLLLSRINGRNGEFLFSVGVIQLAWLIPLGRAAHKRGESRTIAGYITAGSITLLLNTACASMLGGFGNMR